MKTIVQITIALFFGTALMHSQNINTVAGGGFSGVGDGGPATSAQLSNPHGITFDGGGNMFFSDGNNVRVRRINQITGIITTWAGNGSTGYNGEGMAATLADLHSPWGIAIDATGNIYFSDVINNLVRKVSASTGIISNYAGKAPGSGFSAPNGGYNGDGILADSAKLYRPEGIAVDQAGNLYIADWANNRIRKVTASTGIITTVAGNGSNSYNGDGIAATSAGVFGPTDVAVDAAGNIYIADNGNSRVRKVNVSTGLISTLAGNGGIGFSGDGGPASASQLHPYGIACDAAGNVYITDSQNSRVRRIDAGTGMINTVAGTGSNGYNGDGIPATTAQLAGPSSVAVDAAGNLYISDASNNRIRKIGSAVITGLSNDFPFSNAGEISIYPNPISDNATISFKTEQKNTLVKIMDISGREVRTINFSGKDLNFEKAQLTEGIYFVQAYSGSRLIVNQKIVIQ